MHRQLGRRSDIALRLAVLSSQAWIILALAAYYGYSMPDPIFWLGLAAPFLWIGVGILLLDHSLERKEYHESL